MAQRRVSPEEIKETLEQGKQTIKQIARTHGISPRTVSKKFTILRRKSHLPIIHDQDGNFILDKIETQDEAKSLQQFLAWVLAIYRSATIIVLPTKKLLPAQIRVLREGMNTQERRELSKLCTRIRALIDQAEVEEELDEDESNG